MECPFETPVEAKKSSTDPGLRYIASKDKSKVGYVCGDVNKEYAPYIVQAINCHEKLVEALENLREELDEDYIHDREDCTGDCPVCLIDEALKEAEKEK